MSKSKGGVSARLILAAALFGCAVSNLVAYLTYGHAYGPGLIALGMLAILYVLAVLADLGGKR